MNLRTYLLLFLPALLFGCMNQRFYRGKDYTFAGKPQTTSSLLRTDGVYIYRSASSSSATWPYTICKFYPGGQMNTLLTGTSQLSGSDLGRLVDSASSKNRTLFQGYYHTDKNYVTWQQMNAPRRQFYYTYGKLEEGRIILLSQTHRGTGRSRLRNDKNPAPDTLKFIKVEHCFLAPNW